MEKYVYYENIQKAERKQLYKEEFKKNKSVRLWGALAGGMGAAVGIFISMNIFPDKSDWLGQLILVIIFCGGLSALFYGALVKPKIIRLVEKRKNS